MGEKDLTEKMLFDYNDVFSDVVNVLLFNGKRIVGEDSLEPAESRTQYKADDRRVHELERDVLKLWKRNGVMIALYGIENQTKPDNLMPFRVLAYDGASYRSQILKGDQEIYPVITMVLYFGKDHWTGPVSLTEGMDVPEELKKYVSDYRIHVFEISYLSDEQIDMFRSDFKVVAEFFVRRRIDPKYRPKDKTVIKHVDAVLKLLAVFTGDHRYEDIITEYHEGRIEEVTNMCEVIDAWMAEGRAEGEAKAVYSLLQKGRISLEDASEELNIPVAEIEKKMAELGYKIPEKV